jgi:hypothetical protein
MQVYYVGYMFPSYWNASFHYMLAFISVIQLYKRKKFLVSHEEQWYNHRTLTTVAEKYRILNNKYNENKVFILPVP